MLSKTVLGNLWHKQKLVLDEQLSDCVAVSLDGRPYIVVKRNSFVIPVSISTE